MKPILFLTILILTTCCSSCELLFPKSEPQTELEKLPPITQEGKNTFGCLVNGKAFVVRNTSQMSAIYQGGFALSGGIVIDKNLTDIQIFVGELMEMNKSYTLTNDTNKKGQYYLEEENCWFSTGPNFNGILTISFLNQSNYIISGTFEFEAYSSDCQDTVRITKGRFDMQYSP